MSRMDHHPGFPTRPMLRPGVQVCRRSETELQIGLADDLAVVVPDLPEVRAVLAGLRDGVAPGPPARLSPAARRLCQALLAHGLVVDAEQWLPRLAGLTAEAAATWTATVAEAGLEVADVVARRGSARVRLAAQGLPHAAGRLTELLQQMGIQVTASPSPEAPDLVVLLQAGEADRERSDELLRADQPHVVLTVAEGRVTLGPFVVPGLTACLRCLDAALTERDPRRALVLAQAVAAPRGVLPLPVPADLLDVATGLLVRDVSRWVDGLRPATWSTTLAVDPGLEMHRTAWPQHPGCGCCWAGQAVG